MGTVAGREVEPLGRACAGQALKPGAKSAGKAQAALEGRSRPGLRQAPRDAHSGLRHSSRGPRELTGGAQEAPDTRPLKCSSPARVQTPAKTPSATCRCWPSPPRCSPVFPATFHTLGNVTHTFSRKQFHLVSPSPSLLSSTECHCLFLNLSAGRSWDNRNQKLPAAVCDTENRLLICRCVPSSQRNERSLANLKGRPAHEPLQRHIKRTDTYGDGPSGTHHQATRDRRRPSLSQELAPRSPNLQGGGLTGGEDTAPASVFLNTDVVPHGRVTCHTQARRGLCQGRPAATRHQSWASDRTGQGGTALHGHPTLVSLLGLAPSDSAWGSTQGRHAFRKDGGLSRSGCHLEKRCCCQEPNPWDRPPPGPPRPVALEPRPAGPACGS